MNYRIRGTLPIKYTSKKVWVSIATIFTCDDSLEVEFSECRGDAYKTDISEAIEITKKLKSRNVGSDWSIEPVR